LNGNIFDKAIKWIKKHTISFVFLIEFFLIFICTAVFLIAYYCEFIIGRYELALYSFYIGLITLVVLILTGMFCLMMLPYLIRPKPQGHYNKESWDLMPADQKDKYDELDKNCEDVYAELKKIKINNSNFISGYVIEFNRLKEIIQTKISNDNLIIIDYIIETELDKYNSFANKIIFILKYLTTPAVFAFIWYVFNNSSKEILDFFSPVFNAGFSLGEKKTFVNLLSSIFIFGYIGEVIFSIIVITITFKSRRSAYLKFRKIIKWIIEKKN
jgi:hypothetical protein